LDLLGGGVDSLKQDLQKLSNSEFPYNRDPFPYNFKKTHG